MVDTCRYFNTPTELGRTLTFVFPKILVWSISGENFRLAEHRQYSLDYFILLLFSHVATRRQA